MREPKPRRPKKVFSTFRKIFPFITNSSQVWLLPMPRLLRGEGKSKTFSRVGKFEIRPRKRKKPFPNPHELEGYQDAISRGGGIGRLTFRVKRSTRLAGDDQVTPMTTANSVPKSSEMISTPSQRRKPRPGLGDIAVPKKTQLTWAFMY